MSELSAPLMSASDPFYAVRDHLEVEIKQLRIKFDSWQAQLNSVNTASDTAFRVQHEEMRANLAKAEEMCRKIKTAVANVERNRIKYPHIDDLELGNRKAFVQGLENAVGAMRDTFGSRETQGKMESDARKELTARAAVEVASAVRGQNAYNAANRDFITEQSQAQTQIRRQQDQSLDKMGDSLDRLGQMARAIDSELQEQDKIIADIDEKVDETQGKMDGAIKGIEKLLKTKDRCQLCTIAILVIVFLIVAVIAFQ